MRALRICADGTLCVAEVPTPPASSGKALVRVRAAGLNRADVSQRKGKYPAPPGYPQDIPGLEFAGTVEVACGRFERGARVFGLTGGGAQAEYVASPPELLLAIPPALSDVDAGAVPEAYITAYDALHTLAQVEAGERVLIHAIASGVGIAALQLAKAAGCEVFGTSRSAGKLERVRAMGVTFACAPDRFDEEILRATDGAGVNVILDPVGGAYFERNLNVLSSRGRLVILSTMGGAEVSLSLATLMRKRMRLIGTMLRNRSVAEKATATDGFARDVLPLLARGEIKPVIDASYPLDRAAEAYAAMEDNRTFGKIVLVL